MKNLKNILIIQKTSKLSYLIDKYGFDCVRRSPEYEVLKNSMEMHSRNCEKFSNYLNKYKESYQVLDIINDNFLDNKIIQNEIQNKRQHDIIFTLGGDGTFLRAAHYIQNKETLLIGVNTDSKYSKGFYCPIHAEHFLDNYENEKNKTFLTKLIKKEFEEKYLNQIQVELDNNNKYNFINDLYIGEKFMWRISKYNLMVDDKNSQILKSSGIIFSTCKN